jgi:hypothetical protein
MNVLILRTLRTIVLRLDRFSAFLRIFDLNEQDYIRLKRHHIELCTGYILGGRFKRCPNLSLARDLALAINSDYGQENARHTLNCLVSLIFNAIYQKMSHRSDSLGLSDGG